LDDGNRADVFYTISGNVSDVVYTTTEKNFELDNLTPSVYYAVRITAENGVSSQDSAIDNRTVAILFMTLESSKYHYQDKQCHFSVM